MSRMTKDDRLKRVHKEALENFTRAMDVCREERKMCLEDRRFYSIPGGQWEGSLAKQFANKPKFEVNKVHLAVIRIFNEYRNNRIAVSFVSKDGEANDKLAETCASLYRADEQDSSADEAYDNAFEEATAGGFGAWRLRPCYEDEEDDENEHQRIKFEPIFDADNCVYFDPSAKRQDKSDARWVMVLNPMTPQAFKEAYGDEAIQTSLNHDSYDVDVFDWFKADCVYVGEYYLIEEKPDVVRVFASLTGEEVRYRQSEMDEEDLNKLEATGYKELRQKKIRTKKVHKYIMSGTEILEDCGFIAGQNLPVIPMYGKRWFVNGIERCMGHVRLAKDAQRLKNMFLSKLGDIAARSSVRKPIFFAEQMAGRAQMWADDNVNNYPYLLINMIKDANNNPVPAAAAGYLEPPDVPAPLAALLQITEQDMKDILGNQQAGEQIHSNISGKVVELVQEKLDMQSYIYMSNMAKAHRRSGEVWLSMAKELHTQAGRKMKGITKQDEPTSIELMRPMANSETGETELENDLSGADFDVAVTVGPSSNSKRAATVRAVTDMMAITQDPETLQVLGAMAMMNMEGEGISDVRDFFRHKLVKMGAIKPTMEEGQELAEEAQNQPPDPNTTFLMASAKQAEAQGMKAEADTMLSLAKAEESKAKALETMASIDIADRDQIIRAYKALQDSSPSGATPQSSGNLSGNRPAAPTGREEGV